MAIFHYLRFSMYQKVGFAVIFGGLLVLLSFCQRPSEASAGEENVVLADRSALPLHERYLNHNDSVDYVGITVCKSCHGNVHDTYIHTGMGQSFANATRQKSAAEFGKHALVYDTASNFYYRPFWRHDSLMVKEYRLDGEDTIHQRTEWIAYIVGSGQHTNSHMVDFNGYVYQAPITYYTQKGRWDMAPGFSGGFNSRFSRLINMECMTCHNALPTHDIGSVNRYGRVPQGIDCERCHGPGELHVKTKMSGLLVDTSQRPDFTIVNPADLPVHAQMNICQRCHLQGVAVLNQGKFWDDYKPGMDLSEVMQVFLPKYKGEGAEDVFLMASHVERLKKSACYQAGKLSCINCHNPHVSVKATGINHFNAACINCHNSPNEPACTSPIAHRNAVNDNNCSACHMPASKAIDIPHVAITDHYIRVPDKQEEEVNTESTLRFVGLQCMTDSNASALTMARGYLRMYEGFSDRPSYLDSAWQYLQNATGVSLLERLPALVQYYYLKEDYTAIAAMQDEINPTAVKEPFTVYRMGDALLQTGQLAASEPWLSRAKSLMPRHPEFLNKWGSYLIYANRFEEAAQVFEKILSLQPKYVPALSNLGTLKINTGEDSAGIALLQQAIRLNPDYQLAYFNLAQYYYKRYQRSEALDILQQLLRHQPENEQALDMVRAMR